MAIFHMSFKVLKRSEGKSSVYLSAYQNREKTIDNRTGATWDYSKKEGFHGSTILSPAGTPKDLIESSATLWNAVEATEKRKDAQLSRYFDVAIPGELDDDQKRQIVIDYCKENFVAEGMIADIAFHDLDSHNPHAHVMLTMREVTPTGFGNKVREWNNKENINIWRNNWEVIANKKLKENGYKSRIDCRTIEEQRNEAIEKSKSQKKPKLQAHWEAKAIELNRNPMQRISRTEWGESSIYARIHEQEERDILKKIARLHYKKLTHQPKKKAPDIIKETKKDKIKMKEKTNKKRIEELKEKVNALLTKNVDKIKNAFNKYKQKKPKDKPEDRPENFKSKYKTDRFGNHTLIEDEKGGWERNNQIKINIQINKQREIEEARIEKVRKEDAEIREQERLNREKETNKQNIKAGRKYK